MAFVTTKMKENEKASMENFGNYVDCRTIVFWRDGTK
jgi:hypothetical protein